jgi:hypothetical protein
MRRERRGCYSVFGVSPDLVAPYIRHVTEAAHGLKAFDVLNGKRLRVTDVGLICQIKRKAIDMRELTLLETGYLIGLGLLSLMLPLLISFRCPLDATTRKSCMKTVWTGLTLDVIAILVVKASSLLAPYAAGFGLVSCIACVFVLLQQFRAVQQHERRAA